VINLRHGALIGLAVLVTACATPATNETGPERSPEPAPPTPDAGSASPAIDIGPEAPPSTADDVGPLKSALRIRIAAVGDMMIGTDYPRNHLPDDDGLGFLAEVVPHLLEADIAFGNLEGVLMEVSLANNHARDFGEEGRDSSAAALDAVGVAASGREGTLSALSHEDLEVVFVNYAVTKNSNMLLDYETAFEWIATLDEEYDIVVVTFHGGAEGADATHVPFAEEEYYGEPRGDVVYFARGVVDAGADLVIGHGPHVVRGMERYKDRLIAYSLGNFATYYGISVAGIKGIAPILTATLDGEGRFVSGDIVSTIQLRPAGPSIDPQDRALKLIRGLSIEDFGEPGLSFLPDGSVLPVERPDVAPHTLQEES
jgi:hypothetical protein